MTEKELLKKLIITLDFDVEDEDDNEEVQAILDELENDLYVSGHKHGWISPADEAD